MTDWWAQRTCARKKRYPSYEQARDACADLKQRKTSADAVLLGVYRCEVGRAAATHFHIGHATGKRAKVLTKRAEKQRRKVLVKAIGSEDSHVRTQGSAPGWLGANQETLPCVATGDSECSERDRPNQNEPLSAGADRGARVYVAQSNAREASGG